MFNKFLKAAAILQNSNEAYAIAIVVNRENPTSGKPGDKAIIKADGSIIGWIGGGCTRGIVLQEAVKAMEDGKSRLVKIAPTNEKNEHNQVKTYPMTCQSGGSVEVYIEPIIPNPHLFIIGVSPIAIALTKVAAAMDYKATVVNFNSSKLSLPKTDKVEVVDAMSTSLVPKNSYVIVCTQGDSDAEMLFQAVCSEAGYVGFVASVKKAKSVIQEIKSKGVTGEQLKRIKSPVGLDINAKTPEEVAVSILAEIVSIVRKDEIQDLPDTQQAKLKNDGYFLNPVCNIPILKSTAKHVITYKNIDYYFCCDGCKEAFDKEPDKYALT